MKDFLQKLGFTDTEIEEFLSNALVIKCPKKKVLLREGEVPRYLYWATKGIFRGGYTTKEGLQVTRTFFTPETTPFVTAYGSFAHQTPSLSFIDTIEEGELLSWHYDYIKNLEDTDPKWVRAMKKTVDNIFMIRDLKEWQFYTMQPEELYSAFMESAASFVNRVPQHYVASYLGMSPEALSRVKKRLYSKKK